MSIVNGDKFFTVDRFTGETAIAVYGWFTVTSVLLAVLLGPLVLSFSSGPWYTVIVSLFIGLMVLFSVMFAKRAPDGVVVRAYAMVGVAWGAMLLSRLVTFSEIEIEGECNTHWFVTGLPYGSPALMLGFLGFVVGVGVWVFLRTRRQSGWFGLRATLGFVVPVVLMPLLVAGVVFFGGKGGPYSPFYKDGMVYKHYSSTIVSCINNETGVMDDW